MPQQFDPDTHFIYTTTHDGKEHLAQRAHAFIQVDCGRPGCDLIHVVALDKEDTPICEMTMTREQIHALLYEAQVGHG